MLYSEFVQGTGCKVNEYNYKVYRNLEVMYMNSDMSKDAIYEYGKKLVDNSKTEEQLKLEKKVKEEIEEHKREIKQYKAWIEDNKYFAEYWKEQGDKGMVAFYKNPIKTWNQEIKWHRSQIKALKWVIAI